MNATPELARIRALKQYKKQLDVARRLTQAKVRSKIMEAMLNEDPERAERLITAVEPVDPDPAAKRQITVKKAAEELFLSLIFSGGENPITESIRMELSRVLDKEVEFTYPPGGKMRLVARETTGLRALTEAEQALVTPVLRRITSQEVDNNMLGNRSANNPGINNGNFSTHQ